MHEYDCLMLYGIFLVDEPSSYGETIRGYFFYIFVGKRSLSRMSVALRVLVAELDGGARQIQYFVLECEQ